MSTRTGIRPNTNNSSTQKGAGNKPRRRSSGKLGRWPYIASVTTLFFGVALGVSSAVLQAQDIDPWQFYANVANPSMRFVHVTPGLRKEQIADLYGKTLGWSEAQKRQFLAVAPKDERGTLDGYFLPSSYWVNVNANGTEVGNQMLQQFYTKVDKEILKKDSNAAATKSSTKSTTKSSSSTTFTQKVNLDTAVRIASIIEREAAGAKDRRIISGIIWNRLFKGMSLDMDATLQYAKGTPGDWWPDVKSADKKIDSPYNTYKNKGLPPSAISNPSIASIEAAYNPAKTDCLFYLHDNYRGFHCTTTYEDHKDNVRRYLSGR